MGLKRKENLMRRKASAEHELKERLSHLSGKGIKPPKADKDTIVRKIQGEIRAVRKRLNAIASQDKIAEELARRKAERAAAPRAEKAGGKGEKPKKAADEGKAKKPKPEKKAAPQGAPEGGKSEPA